MNSISGTGNREFTKDMFTSLPIANPKSIVNGLLISVPQALAGALPVSPNSTNMVYEKETFRGLELVLKPNYTVFDIGCNCGVFSSLIVIMLNHNAKVHAFDGNATMVAKAKELAEYNQIEGNIKFNHVLVGEDIKEEVEFLCDPRPISVSSTRNKGLVHFHPDAIKQALPMTTIDAYCKANKIWPDIIKLDIEGAEYAAIVGAKKTITKKKPALVIETHGPEINGILGSLEELLELTKNLGYSEIIDLRTEMKVSAKDYLNLYAKTLGHMMLS